MEDPRPVVRRRRPRGGRMLLWALAVLLVLPEAVLWLADQRLIGSPAWRPLAYGYGAFWPGLLGGWQPNFAAQPATMFLSYALLHQGPVHLAGNLAGLLWLGGRTLAAFGTRGLVAVLLAATLAGAALYAMLALPYRPMIGASGAVFGLAGALTPAATGPRARPGTTAAWLGALVLFGSTTWPLGSEGLAWQAHLGGAAAGLAVAALLRR